MSSPESAAEIDEAFWEDDDLYLSSFGRLPTEPIIAKDRIQAFRFLSYGKGTRCVITEDLQMMIAVGNHKDLRGFAKGWFRAHRSLYKGVFAKSEEPGWAQLVLAVEPENELFYGEDDGDIDIEVLDYDNDDFAPSEDGEYEEDMGPDGPMEAFMETLDHGGRDMRMSDGGDGDDAASDLNGEESVFCQNCLSDKHIMSKCSKPLDFSGPHLLGCPFHGVIEHNVDECSILDRDVGLLLVLEIFTTLVCHRRGKAPFLSERLPWTKVVLIARAWGINYDGPFPWSDEFTESQRPEYEDRDDRTEEWYDACPEVTDPATANWSAVEAAIRDGKVPDPGDITEWLPPPPDNWRAVFGRGMRSAS